MARVGDRNPHRQFFQILAQAIVHHRKTIERVRLVRRSGIGGHIGRELQVDPVVDEVCEINDKREHHEEKGKHQSKQNRDLPSLSRSPVIARA